MNGEFMIRMLAWVYKWPIEGYATYHNFATYCQTNNIPSQTIMNKILAVFIFGCALGANTQSNENKDGYEIELHQDFEACEMQCAEV